MAEIKYNYTPGTQSFADGFLGPKGHVGYFMQVDEKKARKIIESQLKEGRQIIFAELGLDGDFTEISTVIYENGEFKNYEGYEGSVWAEPILIIYYKDGPSETHPSWKRVEIE